MLTYHEVIKKQLYKNWLYSKHKRHGYDAFLLQEKKVISYKAYLKDCLLSQRDMVENILKKQSKLSL